MRPRNNDGSECCGRCNRPERARIEKAIPSTARESTAALFSLFDLFVVVPLVLSAEDSYGASRNAID